MLTQQDYDLSISVADANTIAQAKYDVFALLHKSAYDTYNERLTFTKYAYDKVIVADPTQAAQYASFIVTAPVMTSIVADAQTLFDFITA